MSSAARWNTTDVPPSSVRARVLTEHGRLRVQLAYIAELLPATENGDPRDLDRLVAATTELVSMFRAHLDLEDRELLPLLGTIDAWGPVRQADLASEHERQRAELDLLADRLRGGGGSGADLVHAVAVFTEALLADMEEEEATSLDPDTLRDDLVTIRQSGG
jgi:hypothetical protein